MTEPSDDPLADVDAARRGLDAAHDRLHSTVRRARAAGTSWAAIGASLGVSRQAAFKRFGAPLDPRSGAAMSRRTAGQVASLTEHAFGLLAGGDLVTLRALMTPETAEVLDADRLADAWARAVAETGDLVEVVDAGVRLVDGTPLADGRTVTGALVGVVRLVCEAGEWEGRVASDGDGRLTGLLICPPGAHGRPF